MSTYLQLAGLFGMLFAPLVSRALPLFPPVVTGSIIAVMANPPWRNRIM